LLKVRYLDGLRLANDTVQRVLKQDDKNPSAGGNVGVLTDEALLVFGPDGTFPVVDTERSKVFYVYE